MSNAHVVAGANSVTVDTDGKSYDAQVVTYDPDDDISILDVPELPAPALTSPRRGAATGTDALVMGYPGGGTSRPPRPGSGRPSSSTAPTSTATRPSPARSIRSGALCGKETPVAR